MNTLSSGSFFGEFNIFFGIKSDAYYRAKTYNQPILFID